MININIKLLEKFKKRFVANCDVPLPPWSKKLSCLPLHNGNNGRCMTKVTVEFPSYRLGGVEKHIHEECKNIGGQELVDRLPKLPQEVGGETDTLIGIRYTKYCQTYYRA